MNIIFYTLLQFGFKELSKSVSPSGREHADQSTWRLVTFIGILIEYYHRSKHPLPSDVCNEI